MYLRPVINTKKIRPFFDVRLESEQVQLFNNFQTRKLFGQYKYKRKKQSVSQYVEGVGQLTGPSFGYAAPLRIVNANEQTSVVTGLPVIKGKNTGTKKRKRTTTKRNGGAATTSNGKRRSDHSQKSRDDIFNKTETEEH